MLPFCGWQHSGQRLTVLGHLDHQVTVEEFGFITESLTHVTIAKTKQICHCLLLYHVNLSRIGSVTDQLLIMSMTEFFFY